MTQIIYYFNYYPTLAIFMCVLFILNTSNYINNSKKYWQDIVINANNTLNINYKIHPCQIKDMFIKTKSMLK